MADQIPAVQGTEELETTVEMLREQNDQDDAGQAAERTLDELSIDENDEQDDQGKPQEREPSKKNQGWIKSRIDAGVAKERVRIEAEFQARIDAAIAKVTQPLLQRFESVQSKFIEQEAQALVNSGEVKSLENAKILAAQKLGYTPQTVQPRPPEQKQAIPAETQPNDARANILARQAMKLKSLGYDVMEAYGSDPAIQAKVQSGEWDMYDVADSLGAKPKPLVPMRTANGGRFPTKSIRDLSDKEMDNLDTFLESGGVVKGRR